MKNGGTKVALLVFGLNARRIGGIEVHTREVARQLGERGWQLVLCFRQRPAEDVVQYLSLPNVTFEELPNAWTNSWRACLDLVRIVRRHRPRLVHFQFTPFLGLNPWLARLNGASRIVFTDHGSHPEGYRAQRASLWKRAAASFLNLPVSRVVAVSDYNLGVLAALGTIRRSRLCRIFNGADLTRTIELPAAAKGFRERYGIPPERILVTQVSWINPDKGVADVLEAARAALKQEPALHFAFAGDGPSLKEYAGRAAEMGIADHVTWTGLVQDPMGEGVFAASDICCQASRWQEAFGLVIAEAMAFAKPVIATRVGGIPEVVEDGKTGFLVDRGDTSALAEKIVLLARDRDLRNRLGAAGYERAHARFDVRRNAGLLLDVYDGVVMDGAAPASRSSDPRRKTN